MEASDVYDVLKDKVDTLDQRFTNHETHCQERQKVIHGKIDNVSRIVYIGVGVVVMIQFLTTAFLSLFAGA